MKIAEQELKTEDLNNNLIMLFLLEKKKEDKKRKEITSLSKSRNVTPPLI